MLNSEKIWKIWKKIVKKYGNYERKKIVKWYWKYGWNVKRYGKYGGKVSWVVKRYGKYRKKASWIVKLYGKYGRFLC